MPDAKRSDQNVKRSKKPNYMLAQKMQKKIDRARVYRVFIFIIFRQANRVGEAWKCPYNA